MKILVKCFRSTLSWLNHRISPLFRLFSSFSLAIQCGGGICFSSSFSFFFSNEDCTKGCCTVIYLFFSFLSHLTLFVDVLLFLTIFLRKDIPPEECDRNMPNAYQLWSCCKSWQYVTKRKKQRKKNTQKNRKIKNIGTKEKEEFPFN